MQICTFSYNSIIVMTSFLFFFLSLETTSDPLQTLKDSKGGIFQRIQKSGPFSVDDTEEEN